MVAEFLPAGRQGYTRKYNMFYVYALKSKHRNYIYVGMTNNVNRRFKEHNNKKESTTRSYAPFDLILIENYETRIKARKREKYLKSGIGKEYLKNKACLGGGIGIRASLRS